MKNKMVLRIFAAVTLIAVMLSFCACKKNGNTDDSNSASEAYSLSSMTDAVIDESSDDSSTEEVSSSEDASSQTPSESSDVVVSDAPVTVTPDGDEIIGGGTKSDPYLEYPDADSFSVVTVSIPAGKSFYYGIYRVGSRILTINDASAYVVYDGTKRTASGGKVSFEVGPALASDYVLFEIGNSSSVAKSFTVVFTDKKGSYESPEIISSLNGSKISVSLDDGDDVGYFYKYTAERAGTLRIYVDNAEKNKLMAEKIVGDLVTQVSTDAEEDVKSDSEGSYVELTVAKGDVVRINTSILPNKRNKIVAGTVVWWGKIV